MADGDWTADVESLLAGLPERPVREHAEVYEGLHRVLSDALGRLDEG